MPLELNLGLENLQPGSVVYANTENNSNLFNACDYAVGEMVHYLDDMFTQAFNAVQVRKAVKQFGNTQSTQFLVGNEGLMNAQTFSMEGFWESAKKTLIAIWSKICEWWNRFWSIFFSNEKKMEALSKQNGTLSGTVEYDGYDIRHVRDGLRRIKQTMLPQIRERATSFTIKENAAVTYMNPNGEMGETYATHDMKFVSDQRGTAHNEVTKYSAGLNSVHVKLTSAAEVKGRAKELFQILKECRTLQKSIDDTSKKALEAAKKMKDDDASKRTIQNSKFAAKLMRDVVQQAFRACNTEAAKLAANSHFTSK